jgi:hypothetical protein
MVFAEAKSKINWVDKMKYLTVAGLVIWLVLGSGLAVAGTLTVSLEHSTITKAELISSLNFPAENKTAAIINGKAQFNLNANDTGDRFIIINDLINDPIPTRIGDPTKDINQFVGENLQVSVIGNLSDPAYQIKMLPGVNTFWCSDGSSVTSAGRGPGFPYPYIIQSLKTEPQKLEIKMLLFGDLSLGSLPSINNITEYAPSESTHPSTSTSFNPPFSEWVFSHGVDYGGDDSKCNSCHGNLNTIPANLNMRKRDNFIEIPVDKGFCYRCHYGKSGTGAGLVGEPGCQHPYPQNPYGIPGFDAPLAIAALLVVILIRRR